MTAILGCINMKKRLLPLFVTALTLTSCGNSGLTVDQAKEVVANYSTDNLYPYYKVIGNLDFNNEIVEVDATFDKEPVPTRFVPYARYNDGFFNAKADFKDEDEDILIYGMASRSYWLRAPMRINAKNFYAFEKDGEGQDTEAENSSCAHYILEHLITSYIGDSAAAANPAGKHMVMEKLEDGGLLFYGRAVHTKVKIDNYPCYPDPATHPELDDWEDYNPTPCYLSIVNAKVDIAFYYNSDGWLTRETMVSTEYNSKVNDPGQISLDAVYTYKFGD